MINSITTVALVAILNCSSPHGCWWVKSQHSPARKSSASKPVWERQQFWRLFYCLISQNWWKLSSDIDLSPFVLYQIAGSLYEYITYFWYALPICAVHRDALCICNSLFSYLLVCLLIFLLFLNLSLCCIFGPDPASYAGHIGSLFYGALEWGLLRGVRTAIGDLEDTFSEGTSLQPVQRPGRIKAGSPNLH